MRIIETEGGGGYSMLDVRVGSEGSSHVPIEQLKAMQAAGALRETSKIDTLMHHHPP